MFHFAFFLRNFNKIQKKEEMQNIYDFFFRQLELSIREIGYGGATINKKMKIYINTFHSMIIKIKDWENISISKKNEVIKDFINIDTNIDELSKYFDNYLNYLTNNPFNLFTKSVIKTKF